MIAREPMMKFWQMVFWKPAPPRKPKKITLRPPKRKQTGQQGDMSILLPNEKPGGQNVNNKTKMVI